MQKRKKIPALLLTLLLMLVLAPAAYADTDANTPQITQQPDQLVLQLGARWAGVEFELRTDAGVFPVPVVVDESGILRMDLGGSTTYTLSCINSTVPIPDPGLEKKKKLLVYDPSCHDYSVDKPVWEEIANGHFVYGNQKELEGYRKEYQSQL